MVENTALKCTPIRPDIQYQNSYDKKLSFGSENKEELKKENDTVEIKAAKTEKEFSFKRAANQFYEGAISPIRKIISSPLALGSTVVAGWGIKKLATKHKWFSILAISATGAFGLGSIANGVLKFIKSKDNVEAKENSFKDMGKGTIILGKCK